MALDGAGVRETHRQLEVARNIVSNCLKKLAKKHTNTRLLKSRNDPVILAEADEQWSFIGCKKQQRWLFYALDKISGKVLDYVLGKRNKATLNKLLQRLSVFNVRLWFADKWPVYTGILLDHLHIASKNFTQRIERHNLNLRLHIKRLNRERRYVFQSQQNCMIK